MSIRKWHRLASSSMTTTTPELPRTDAGEGAGGSRLAASVEGGNNTGASTGELARFTPDVMCSEDGTHYCGMRPDTKGLWCGHADATAVIDLLRARHLKNAIADSQMQDRAEQAEAAFKISDATCSKYIKLLGDAEARVRELEAALIATAGREATLIRREIALFPRPFSDGAEVLDLSIANKESALRAKLIEMGWATPEQVREIELLSRELKESLTKIS